MRGAKFEPPGGDLRIDLGDSTKKLLEQAGYYDHRLTQIGTEIGQLCAEKNEAYGDSFSKAGAILRELYPDGLQPEQYDDMLAIVRILDKLFRIATRKDAFGESPFKDIAGYAILGVFKDGK